jgi:hypothetical protein
VPYCRLAHSSICTIRDNADRIKVSVKSGPKVFVQQDYHSPIGMNHTKTMGVSYIFIALEINIV